MFNKEEGEPVWQRNPVTQRLRGRGRRQNPLGEGQRTLALSSTCVVRHGGLVRVTLFPQDNVAKLEDS